ncbi:hypothetical protein [Cellulomonas sp. ICMP 17802]|uniref:hypothetical protein n=1 Tax=Cellulomonas sp. ICMP 17802 TaxID=3239199 RepID=UPI00351B5CD7
MSIDTVRTRVPGRSSVGATARWLLGMYLYLAAWFWVIVVVAAIGALVVIDQVGTVQNSILAFARQGALWFPFALFIAVTAAYLPVHVAAGLTRRSLALGSILAAVCTALANGIVFGGLLLLERAVFGALGWRWRILDDLVPSPVDAGTFLLSTTLTFLVAYVSGLLVCIAYQRMGGWWATLALPLTAGPIFLVTALLAPEAGPFGRVGGAQPLLVGAALSLLVSAVLAVAFDRLVRGASVPARTS